MNDNSIFVREPEEIRSRRDKFYIEHRYTDKVPGLPLIIARINVPSRYILSKHVYSVWSEVHNLLFEQCGLKIHRGISLKIEATFLLRNKYAPESSLRAFTASVNTPYQEANLIVPFSTVYSIEKVRQIFTSAVKPDVLFSKLDSSNSYKDSSWEFAGVISVIIVFNARQKVRPYQRKSDIIILH